MGDVFLIYSSPLVREDFFFFSSPLVGED